MMIREHFPLLDSWKVEIVGTDLSSEMVERATAGRFMRMEVNRGLPARFLLKYLVRSGDDWEVSPEIRRLCRFQQWNLCDGAPWSMKFDVIFLRNVMIYFTEATRQKLLRRIHDSLASDGALFLASTEQASLDSHWEAVLTAKTTWYRPLPLR